MRCHSLPAWNLEFADTAQKSCLNGQERLLELLDSCAVVLVGKCDPQRSALERNNTSILQRFQDLLCSSATALLCWPLLGSTVSTVVITCCSHSLLTSPLAQAPQLLVPDLLSAQLLKSLLTFPLSLLFSSFLPPTSKLLPPTNIGPKNPFCLLDHHTLAFLAIGHLTSLQDQSSSST